MTTFHLHRHVPLGHTQRSSPTRNRVFRRSDLGVALRIVLTVEVLLLVGLAVGALVGVALATSVEVVLDHVMTG